MIESQALTTAISSLESGSLPSIGVSLANNPNITTGQYVPRADTITPPTLTSQNQILTSGKMYLIACLDLDAPFISFSFLGPILHFLQPGAQVSATNTLTYSEEAIATWHPAGPPPGAAPHRYTFLVYEQPAGFDAKSLKKPAGYGLSDRARFRWDDFAKTHGLGEIIASNYFTSN